MPINENATWIIQGNRIHAFAPNFAKDICTLPMILNNKDEWEHRTKENEEYAELIRAALEMRTALEHCVRDMTASHIVDKIIHERNNPHYPLLKEHNSLIKARELLAKLYN